MHIDHLVPLERSNFAYVLGSSGVTSLRDYLLWKNVSKMLTHMHVSYTLSDVGTFTKEEFKGCARSS